MSTKAGIQFIRDSYHMFMEEPAEGQSLPQPPVETPYEPALTTIDLKKFEELTPPAADMWQVMQRRRTLRHYQSTPLSLDELTLLLWFSQGVKYVSDRPVTMRTVPSGGARHPFETYLIVSRVDGLEPGLYRYQAVPHRLALLKAGADLGDQLSQKAVPQHHVRDAAVSFWWMVDSVRTTWRYSTRGYRYLLMDAGHICQNLTLAAEGITCGVCAIGSFDDELLNEFFGVDGEQQFVIYGATVGKR